MDHYKPKSPMRAVSVKFVFIDVVGFSKRDTAVQFKIVAALQEIVRTVVAECLEETELDKVSYLPTGDGLCICFVDMGLVDIHIRSARQILAAIFAYNKGTPAYDDETFSVRIGVNEASNIIQFNDITGRRNFAGRGLNDAARIMDAADGGNILVGEDVFRALSHFDRRGWESLFAPLTVRIKGNRELAVYQYVGHHLGVSDSPPRSSLLESHRAMQLFQAKTEGEYNLHLIDMISATESSNTIAYLNQRWVFDLFPSLVAARMRGVEIHAASKRQREAPNSVSYRQTLLTSIGCAFTDKSTGKSCVDGQVGVSVAFADLGRSPEKLKPGRRLLVRSDTFSSSGHSDELHEKWIFESAWDIPTPICDPLIDALCPDEYAVGDDSSSTKVRPTLQRFDINLLIAALKARIRQYTNARIEFESVPVDELSPTTRGVVGFKLRQIPTINSLLDQASAERYDLVGIVGKNDFVSPILPPVVEEHDGTLAIIEGHHRLYWCRANGHGRVKAIVVRGVIESLQAAPRPWSDVKQYPSHRRAPREDSELENFRLRRFARDIERQLRTNTLAWLKP